MKRARFSYRKLMALCAVLALTLVQSATAFRGAAPTTSRLAVADPDLSSELRTLEKYSDDLAAYQIECSKLGTFVLVRDQIIKVLTQSCQFILEVWIRHCGAGCGWRHATKSCCTLNQG